MNPEERRQKIISYGGAYEKLVVALEGYPEDMWQFRDAHGCWSIQEHLVHLADSEANSYIRCRRFIAEPGGSLMAYDEDQWARALDYQNQSPYAAVELFRWLRGMTLELVKGLPQETWSHGAHHPETGDMTLEDWLDIYERHVPEHLGFMQENFEAWEAAGRP